MTDKRIIANLEAEQSVLGGILLDNDALDRAAEIVQPGDFYRVGHQRILEAMMDLSADSIPIDLLTLPEALKKNGDLEKCGGVHYISSLVNVVANAANIRNHCRIVREKALLRGAVRAANDVLEMAYSDPDLDEFRDKAAAAFFAMADRPLDEGFTHIKSLVAEASERTEQRYEQKTTITGVATGFKKLDFWTAGLQKSDLIILAGRPGQGKTAFALNVAENVAAAGGTIGIFSLEMSKDALTDRFISAMGPLDSGHVRTGYLSDLEWDTFHAAANKLHDYPIFINDSSRLSLFDIITRARRLKREHGMKLLILDHLGFIHGKVDRYTKRYEEVGEISKALKGLAKDLQMPVMLLCQLHRGVEARTDKRPMLSDLRESGDLEQDADLVLFMYRDEFYKPCSCAKDAECTCGQRGKAEIIIGKQRNGRTGTVPLTFFNKYMLFTEA